MRYVWDAEDDYAFGPLQRLAMQAVRRRLQQWDCEAATRVDHFIANSQFVRERIRSYYGRDAAVIHPPVDTDFFTPPASTEKNARAGFYLAAGALAPYKRFDLIVEACKQLGCRLVVAGQGADLKKLQKMATPQIVILGAVSDEKLRELYRSAAAMIVAAREDFGMTTVEAQACGCPVVAFAAGGSTEIVADGINGIFFADQQSNDLAQALRRFESMRWPVEQVRSRVERFSREAFRTTIQKFVAERIESRPEPRIHELQRA
jgi:glycosyltransferase involved in cell wall biosynthesis